MANATVTVLEADGLTQTDVIVLDVGRQAAAASKSVAASTEDKAVLDAIAASLALLDNSIATGNEIQVDVVGALPAGTNAIGKLAANSGVDIGDVDVTSVTPGTAAGSLGKAEDAAHSSGDTGVMVLAVRQDSAAALAGTTGDYIPLTTTALGSLRTSVTKADGTVVDPVAAGTAASAEAVPITIATDDAQFDALEARVSPKFVTVSMSTPTDAQDAGDVIAATQVVAACTPGNDIPGVLHSACLIDTDDVGVNIKAVFFSANTTLGTEDAAPDIDDTEALTVLGIVDFAAADYVDLGGSKYNTKTNIGLAIVPATGTDDVYMALYSPTGGTWASGVITVRLGFL